MDEHDVVTRPSRAVMVDIGPGHGALVLQADAEMLGEELEISSADEPARRQHVFVLMRTLPRGTAYAAVFPRLPAGEYLLWGAGDQVIASALVEEGRVASVRWPAHAASSRASGPTTAGPHPRFSHMAQGV